MSTVASLPSPAVPPTCGSTGSSPHRQRLIATTPPSDSPGSNGPLGQSFMDGFIVLNIINFVDMTMARREKNRVSWDVRRVLLL